MKILPAGCARASLPAAHSPTGETQMLSLADKIQRRRRSCSATNGRKDQGGLITTIVARGAQGVCRVSGAAQGGSAMHMGRGAVLRQGRERTCDAHCKCAVRKQCDVDRCAVNTGNSSRILQTTTQASQWGQLININTYISMDECLIPIN